MGKTKMALAAAGEWQTRHPLGRTYFVRFPGTLEALYTVTLAQAMAVEAGGGREKLIRQVQETVFKKTGYRLEPEVGSFQ